MKVAVLTYATLIFGENDLLNFSSLIPKNIPKG